MSCNSCDRDPCKCKNPCKKCNLVKCKCDKHIIVKIKDLGEKGPRGPRGHKGSTGEKGATGNIGPAGSLDCYWITTTTTIPGNYTTISSGNVVPFGNSIAFFSSCVPVNLGSSISYNIPTSTFTLLKVGTYTINIIVEIATSQLTNSGGINLQSSTDNITYGLYNNSTTSVYKNNGSLISYLSTYNINLISVVQTSLIPFYLRVYVSPGAGPGTTSLSLSSFSIQILKIA